MNHEGWKRNNELKAHADLTLLHMFYSISHNNNNISTTTTIIMHDYLLNTVLQIKLQIKFWN